MHQAYFVYKITSPATPKVYIGVTSSPSRRMKEHKKYARNYPKYPIHFAMRKYGPDTFEMIVLYGSYDRTHIFEIEPYFIKEYKSLVPYGFNICEGGESGPSGPEHCIRMTQVWASKSPEEMSTFKEKMKTVGANISEETRQKRSAAAKAQHANPEKKAQMKVALITAGQDSERRKAISERAKARWSDPAFRAKMQAKYATPEQREKKRNASLARWAISAS